MQPKGRELELRIEQAFDKLNSIPGYLAIRIEVKKVQVRGQFVYTKKQPFDFLIMTSEGVFAFDAKECSGDKFYPSKVQDHQKRAIETAGRFPYCKSALLVWFKNAPRLDNVRWITDMNSPATASSGVAFGWEMFVKEAR